MSTARQTRQREVIVQVLQQARARDRTRHCVNVRGPADEGIKRFVLDENFRRGRSIPGPFEIYFTGINPSVQSRPSIVEAS